MTKEMLKKTKGGLLFWGIMNPYGIKDLSQEGLSSKHFKEFNELAVYLWKGLDAEVTINLSWLQSVISKDKVAQMQLNELFMLDQSQEVASNVSFFAEVIKEEYKRDLFYSVFDKALTEARENIDVQKYLSDFSNVEEESLQEQGLEVLKDIKQKALDELFKEESTILTGHKTFDKPTGGVKKGKLIVLAGRPGMGKTAYALSLLEGLAEQGVRCGIISLEMTQIDLIERLICMQGYSNSLIRENKHKEQETEAHKQYISILDRVCNLPIFIDDKAGINKDKLKQKIYSLHAKGCGVICIDYLQLISITGSKAQSTTDAIGEITIMLKALANNLGVTIILLSQLSREVEKRRDKFPTLADLRGSGSIEQDADIVIFLFRPQYYIDAGTLDEKYVVEEMKMDPNQTCVNFAKNRGGVNCGEMGYFFGEYYYFQDSPVYDRFLY
jgi:replicative DNA helicase